MSKSAWSDAITAKLIASYNGDNSELKTIAAELGKTIPAVRAKLVNLKVYQKPEAVAKVGGASSVRKAHLVRDIAKLVAMESDDLESLEKATKPTLEALAAAIFESQKEAILDDSQEIES